MDSLYAHALHFFTDRFGQPPMTGIIPKGLPSKACQFAHGVLALLVTREDAIERYLEPVWSNLNLAVAHDRCGVSMYHPPAWYLREVDGWLDVLVITEPDPMVVAEALSRTPAPEDVHPFADRIISQLVPSLAEEMREALGGEALEYVREHVRPRQEHCEPATYGDAVKWDACAVSAPIMPAMTEGGEPGPLRDVGADTTSAWLKSRNDAKNPQSGREIMDRLHDAESMPLWGDLADGDLLQAMGTDAAKWAEAFLAIRDQREMFVDASLLTGWFANAIEAGREAGRTQLHCHPAGGYLKRPDGFPTYYDITEDVFRPVSGEWADAILHRERTQARAIRDVRKALEHLDLNVQHFQVREGPAPDAAG